MELDLTELILAENAAARQLRKLVGTVRGWGELIAFAQHAIGEFQEYPTDQARYLLDDDTPHPISGTLTIVSADDSGV